MVELADIESGRMTRSASVDKADYSSKYDIMSSPNTPYFEYLLGNYMVVEFPSAEANERRRNCVLSGWTYRKGSGSTSTLSSAIHTSGTFGLRHLPTRRPPPSTGLLAHHITAHDCSIAMDSQIIPAKYQVFYMVIPTITIVGNALIVYVTIRAK
ncbi:hypothetical protein KIN20_003510 [Parelaphostrongylus tenuis]|uniref:G-protein coupled receptors family 1 profile domain-containing protein n=1 Tax=Parelaphostrongylus tenuis TaxID=148309 RepID=A0AAD5QDS4_PARTN|nr:hypothetical protein KIN20_003510 [Parelaphostrongylus tenuis]